MEQIPAKGLPKKVCHSAYGAFSRKRMSVPGHSLALAARVAEFGLVFPQGPGHLKQVAALLEDGHDRGSRSRERVAQLYRG